MILEEKRLIAIRDTLRICNIKEIIRFISMKLAIQGGSAFVMKRLSRSRCLRNLEVKKNYSKRVYDNDNNWKHC